MPVDDGDAVAHGLDGADLLGQGGQVEQLHLRAEDGDDALGAGGFQTGQFLLQLGQTALSAPVILLVAGGQLEAADQGGVLHHLEDDVLLLAVGGG